MNSLRSGSAGRQAECSATRGKVLLRSGSGLDCDKSESEPQPDEFQCSAGISLPSVVSLTVPRQAPPQASNSQLADQLLVRYSRVCVAQLDATFYARILQSSDPEGEFGVPIRTEWLHFSQLEPGHMFLINRPSWNVATSRASQKRNRDGEDQLPFGGWNRRGPTRVVSIPGGATSDSGEPQQLLVESFAAQNPPRSYRQELPRKTEIWLVPQVRTGRPALVDQELSLTPPN